MSVTLHLGDCLEYMRGMEAGSVLTVTDPQYGLNSHNMRAAASYMDVSWDNAPATDEQINKILSLSKNSIIWGGNYFNLPPTRCFLIWDKQNGEGLSFADCEMAWTDFNRVAKIYRHRPQSMDGGKVHPYQKPLSLMQWCIENFTKPDDVIFDPFMGSGTTGVAAVQLGRNFIGCEIDPQYFAIAERRIAEAKLQPALFQVEQPQPQQAEMGL